MGATRIAVVDSGAGNLRSVVRALRYVAPEADIQLVSTPEGVRAADRVVLPGQGAIGDSVQQLRRDGLADAVIEAARTKPLLGVCVGMQMLFEMSEEAPDVAALGIFPGKVLRFRGTAFDEKPAAPHEVLKVPHMGWNRVRQVRSHPLWEGVPDNSFFYFVHSYYVAPADTEIAVGQTYYGFDFTSVVAHANIFATQFHPEKSAAAGLRVYRNFVHWKP